MDTAADYLDDLANGVKCRGPALPTHRCAIVFLGGLAGLL